MGYEWNPRPPTIRERVASGIWLIAFLAAEVNYQAGWRWFNGYDKQVSYGLVLLGLVVFVRLMPGVVRR